jgi:hypothetical protein
MAPLLDERSRRRWAASEARTIGHGGVSAISRRRVWRDGRYIEGLKISKIVPQLAMAGYVGGVEDVNRR